MKLNFTLFASTILLIIFGSCTSTKKVTYMPEAETIPTEALKQIEKGTDPIVMPGDLLEITVSSINVDAVRPFNRLSYMTEMTGVATNYNNDTNRSTYYIVDDKGSIDFPVLGKLNIGGMNKDEIQELIANRIYPKYITDKPGVDVRFKNFKVTVIGEVKNPGVYTSANERLNIMEALAMAGDLNITGVRDNIMIIRTQADGTREIYRMNLNDKNSLLSPYYNLQQNDVIYVQPNASKARSSWSIPPALSLTLSSLGTLISIATLIVTIVK